MPSNPRAGTEGLAVPPKGSAVERSYLPDPAPVQGVQSRGVRARLSMRPANLWIGVLLIPIAALALAWGMRPAQGAGTSGAPGTGSVVDDFPLGTVVGAPQDGATSAVALSALNQRLPLHAAVVSSTAYHEDRSLVSNDGAVRSQDLTIYVFALSDGTYRAAGVLCGVGGCFPWPEYEPKP